MENFVKDYFSVEKFKKAYGRLMEELGDRSLWPKVDIGFHVGAPLARRKVGRQRKNRIKECLEGGGGEVERRQVQMRLRKQRNQSVKNSSVETITSLGIEQIAQSVPSMVPKKGKYSLLYQLWQVLIVLSIMTFLIPLFMCE
jgi:hypothetical protein